MNTNSFWWYAPEYFSRWRLFPRAFISMYIYLLYEVCIWFMALPEPNNAQAGLVSVVVGAGAAWFGIYCNSTSSKHEPVAVPQQTGSIQANTIASSPQPVQRVNTVEEADELPAPRRNLG